MQGVTGHSLVYMWDCIQNISAHAELFFGSVTGGMEGWLGKGSVGDDPETSGRCLTMHYIEHIDCATQKDTGESRQDISGCSGHWCLGN